MTATRVLKPTATLSINVGGGTTITPRIVGGTVTLDASWAPYCQATLTVSLDDLGWAEQIDPRAGQRGVITASLDGITRTFNLGIRGRRVLEESRTIVLSLASDEALLQDWRTLTGKLPTTGLYGTVGVCNAVISEALSGTLLQFSSVSGSLQPRWIEQNLFRDPTATTVDNFTEGNNASGMQVIGTVGGSSGTSALRWTATAAGLSNMLLGAAAKGYPQVSPGRAYEVSVDIRSNVARSASIVQRYYNAQGVLLRTIEGSAQTTSTGAWTTRLVVRSKAPNGAAYMFPYVTTLANTAGQFHYIDGILMTEVPILPNGDLWWQPSEFFTGAIPGASHTGEWEGTAHDSVSTRTPITPRSIEALWWAEGVSAWDYLQPLVESVEQRLYCDEQRRWYTVAEAHTVAGSVTMTPGNMPRSDDEISRDGDDVGWATGVAIHFKWEGGLFGRGGDYWDTAGTPGKVRVIERNRPLQRGAAAMVLRSMLRQGRKRAGTTITDYNTTPGQALTVKTLQGEESNGRVRSVTFDLVSGLMDVTGEDMTD